MKRRAAAALALLVAAAALAPPLAAQSVSGVERSLLRQVMPRADRFEPKSGDPPVIRAYREGELLGFVFLTEDIPPEQLGYSGPVQAVVGLRLDATLAGARVTDYWESYRSSMGDFLRDPGVQEQFRGKHVGDPFQVNGDVARVTRATISTQALARGIRDASRRVAQAYRSEMEGALETGPVVLDELTWYEMQTRGVLKRILIEGPQGHLDIAMTWLPDDSVAAFFVGEEDVPRLHAAAERADLADPAFVLYALAGPRLRYFLREGWYLAQEGDTVAIPERHVYSLGVTDGGRVASESTMAGVFMLDDRLDRSRPFSLLYDFEDHEGYYAADFDALEPGEAVAEAGAEEGGPEVGGGGGPAEPAADARPGAAEPAAGSTTEPTAEPAEEPAEEPAAGAAAPATTPTRDSAAPTPPEAATPSGDSAEGAPAAPAEEAPASGPASETAPTGPATPELTVPDFTFVEEGSELSRTLARTDWGRVAGLAVVLALALAAFFLKRLPALRWASLTATVVFLGFVDGGFLSISHLTAGIQVGPAVYLRDLPLLIMVTVTVATTLVWGRFFCGFLCPFGALQDFMERLVPERFRVRIPWRIHLPALKVKYAVLALVVLLPILGIRTSVYQYVEPFGTVFFLSPSLLLWSIAGVFLVGAALVPRFYCRYVCPLGAGLALASTVAPGRIRRVEQCEHCKVCQHDCPTGAIDGPDIDFEECVRCNRCETNLLEGAGTCRWTMEEFRHRLVQLEAGAGRRRTGV